MAKVLVIDDAKLARLMMSKVLTDQGHVVVQAENGEQGVAMAMAESFDLIFCDLLMPVMDGYGVLTALKQEGGYDCPVVILSADMEVETRERCLRLGANDFLSKPPSKAELLAIVDKQT